jgi:hypothetical protein
MELRDGFIVGIYNYCDRWCETCAFTSRCAVFADVARYRAAADPQLRAVVDAPPLPQEAPPPPPRWLQELIDEVNEAAREPISPEEMEQLLPKVAPQHAEIEARARAYCFSTAGWLEARAGSSTRDPADPRAVIGWFCTFIPPKVYRALTGLTTGWWEPHWPADYDGSAKAALLGIERSHAAWLAIVERGLASMTDAAPFVADLVWLGEALERVFPNARAFVRPGFDEPGEVEKLLAGDDAG